MLSWCHPGSDYPFDPSGAIYAVQVSRVIPLFRILAIPGGNVLEYPVLDNGGHSEEILLSRIHGDVRGSSLAHRSIQQLRWCRFPSFPALWNQVELYTLPVRRFQIFTCVVKSIHGMHVKCQVPKSCAFVTAIAKRQPATYTSQGVYSAGRHLYN